MLQHFNNWNAGHVQKHVVRIIALLPLYAIESWLALYYRQYSIYIETLKESYEAYVIWNFFFFLIALLGEEPHVVSVLRSKGKRGNHPFPFNLVTKPWNGHEIMQKCSFGVLQYVLIKNIMIWVVMLLEYLHVYDEGEFKLQRGYLYVTIVNTWSQTWALYCLAKFYYIMREELAHYQAVGKFLCVKVVVFWTWWQSIMINFMAYHTTLISSSDNNTLTINTEHTGSRFSTSLTSRAGELYSWTDGEIAKGLQDFLITIEMFLASVAFTYYFSHEEFLSTGAFHAFSPNHYYAHDEDRDDSSTTMSHLITALSGGATAHSAAISSGIGGGMRSSEYENDYGGQDGMEEGDLSSSSSDRRSLINRERRSAADGVASAGAGAGSGWDWDDRDREKEKERFAATQSRFNTGSAEEIEIEIGISPRGKHKSSPFASTSEDLGDMTLPLPLPPRRGGTTGGALSAMNAAFYPDDIFQDIRKNVLGSAGKKAAAAAAQRDIELVSMGAGNTGTGSTADSTYDSPENESSSSSSSRVGDGWEANKDAQLPN
jgi:hypothetical protein